jgi:hypothetical protein
MERRGTKEESWHRRQAVMLASQLPEKYEDAVAVLRALERALHEYLKEPDGPLTTPVIKLREV